MVTRMFPPMPARPDLDALAKAAMDRFDRLTPDQQREHRAAQRRSWVRGELMLEHPDMTREQADALSARMDEANSFGALHIAIGDGNLEDEHIEFCLAQPGIAPDEVKLAEDLLSSEFELRVFAYWLAERSEARALLATLKFPTS